ncbi:imidazole glycerol phosphate synthase subunit HisH [Rhodopseudomonas pseudopalustris]|uniref:Imidazole glycerol phosphate synthase subunit HisH n=2 Tax=Rhodopseudomonas pseudopalustris TaxID=1513892 RepID=A0A1H8UL47_9BRAD|nr:glutamine amidotransferase [Rhodopseudomonas pseudopalustris]
MIAIVDYDVGTVASVSNMLRKVGAKATITRDPDILRAADKLVLPGVGSFDEAISNLRRLELFDLLNELVVEQQKPILGICLGAQLVANGSEEGTLPGFGWIDAQIVRFKAASNTQLRIPHMGWNTITPTRPGIGIFTDAPDPMRFYFVHSYHMLPASSDDALATTDYGYRFVSVMGRKNVLAMQFHPEKSHKFGLQIFRQFSESFVAC